MKIIYIFIIVLLIIGFEATAQTGISSPYSAFGLGYINEVNNIHNRSMGGIGIGTRDRYTINLRNPASYSAFDSTSFVFEGGMTGHYTGLKTQNVDEEIASASLSQLLFGFPVTKWWRSSFGLVPFSSVGYNVVDFDTKEDIGKIEYSFEGDGGVSRVFWGNAFQPIKSLSIGINASYLFGTIDHTQSVSFPDSLYIINTKESNSVTIGDLHFDLGVQYFTKFKNDLEFVAGATFHPKINLNANRDYIARSYLGVVNGIDIFRDTIAAITDEKGVVTMPMGYGVGFSFAKTDQWLAGFDYKFDRWSEYKSFGVSDSLVNSHSFNIGGLLVPDYSSLSYLKRINYRLGAKYSFSYLKLRGEQINSFGITFGIGLPLRSLAARGSKSMVNLGIEVGRRGTLDKGLIQENYINVYFGISIYEWWFYKRRYQ